jgi:adenylylsulfate kinase
MSKNAGFTVWLTGMLGTGKSTITAYVAARLRQVGRNVEVLDEKELADELWQGTGDTKEDRNLVVKRMGYVANLLSRNDVAVLVAAVSPYKAAREENRRIIGRYLEVYVDCPTEKLIQRDNTGKYKKALSGEIPNFIGITEPYEPPTSPEVTIHSDVEPIEEGARKIFQSLLDLSLVTAEELKVITGKRMKANPVPKKARRAATPAKGERKARPGDKAARVGKKAAGKQKGS